MATLDQVEAHSDPIHLLLIADTKVGKSTYAAQAAIDGFTVVYLDADNGISALRNACKGNAEALKRIHYFSTSRPMTFLTNFMRSKEGATFRWLPKQNKLWGKLVTDVSPEDEIWEFDITKIPAEWLFVTDSWTAVAADALGIGSADQKAALLDGTDQGIYGEANANLTYICNLMQKYPGNLIVQAHGTKFEVYDKPPGVMNPKQKDMILRETIDVPVSSSRAHGQLMANRFNHIGWMNVTNLGETEIDFTRRPNRVGGGPPNIKKKVQDLPFSKLLPSIPVQPADNGLWYRKHTHESLLARK